MFNCRRYYWKVNRPVVRFCFLALIVLSGVTVLYFYQSYSKIPSLPSAVKSGDVVFVNGYTISGLIVSFLGGQNSAPAHVGILYIKDNEFQIIHADPLSHKDQNTVGVKVESWKSFAARGIVHSGQVFRHKEIDGNKIARISLDYTNKNIPFDWKFEWGNRSALYCTEFIDQVFRTQGVDLLSHLKAHPKIVFPSHISSSKHLEFVAQF